MLICNKTKASWVAARIVNMAGRINKDIKVTISEGSPESTQLTGTIPSVRGWKIATDVPLSRTGRKDYIEFLKKTTYKEVHIRLATVGGRSKVYVR
jgi:hypothetical protein